MSCNGCLPPITKRRDRTKPAIAAGSGSLIKCPADHPISAISAVAITLHAANKFYGLRFLEESKCDLPPEILQSLHIPLDNTRAVLEALHVKLKPFVTSKGEVKTSKLGAIRWAFNQKDVKQLGEQLSNGTSTLNMTLAVVNVIKTTDIKNDTSEIIDYLGRLKLDQRLNQEKLESYAGADAADTQQSDPRMQKFNIAMTRFLKTASTTVDSPPQSPWAPPTNAAQVSSYGDDLEDEDDLNIVHAPGLTRDGEVEIHNNLTTKSTAFLNHDGQSALHLAAMLDEYITGDVLRRGVDIDTRNLDGETPLMCAVRTDKMEVVALLLKNNANANARASESGKTCLHLATAKDKTGIITRLLLKRGAGLEGTDEMGLTA